MDQDTSRLPTLEELTAMPFADERFPLEMRDVGLGLYESADGLGGLPPEPWEKIEIDGAKWWQRNLWAIAGKDRDDFLAQAIGPDDLPLTDLDNTVVLRERLLLFPSAPLKDLGDPDPPEAYFHSYRLLDLPARTSPARRVYLLTNGLNEVDDASFFYRLASWILSTDPESVCLLRPFPHHLTRADGGTGFSPSPLDRYLRDSIELFRDYLKYLVETKWLLSALVPRSRYDLLSGLMLSGAEPLRGGRTRQSAKSLGGIIGQEIARLRRAAGEPRLETKVVTEDVAQAIASLRKAIGWSFVARSPEPPTQPEPPMVHTIGYSLGGFIAQSIFITWPYIVASCNTVCSGGALENLSPTAFAHAEEWQTLIHSLRYRLDSTMMKGEMRPAGNSGRFILGMRNSTFHYLLRVFYEIFEQEYRSSYQSRLSEYIRRFLFIVGGNDPIVRPLSVLDAAPPEGANMIMVADLSHFLASNRNTTDVEASQRKFWLPEAAGIVARFADPAEEAYLESVGAGWLEPQPLVDERVLVYRRPLPRDVGEAYVPEREWRNVGPEGAMGWPTFDRFLNAFVVKGHTTAGLPSGQSGYIFIFRNEIPTFMLPDEFLIHRARSLHHSESYIRDYVDMLRMRRDKLFDIGKSVMVVLSEDALLERTIRRMYRPGEALYTSESPMGEYLTERGATEPGSAGQMVAEFCSKWIENPDPALPRVRIVKEGEFAFDVASTRLPIRTNAEGDFGDALADIRRALDGPESLQLSRLPDCWVYVAADAMGLVKEDDEAPIEERASRFVSVLGRQASKALKSSNERRRMEMFSNTDVLRAIGLSRARNNQRYRGRIYSPGRELNRSLIHGAVALSMSSESRR